ncbi:MAG: inositol phosphorylceramide synthase [Deltaproteobacteria bacterium]|nr:inositol phosphorylceramide synthase [Deltaproteobacteria bacterium]
MQAARRVLERKGVAWMAWKLAIGLATVGWVALLYMPVSEWTSGRHHDLMTPLDRAIPFVPWTWWIYFPGYLFGLFVAVVAIRRDAVFYRTVLAIMIAQVLNSAIYLLLPSTYPRPLDWQGAGLTAEAIRWFWTVDPPNNTFPSSHVTMAVLAAWGLWRERNPWRWIPSATALGIILTVHTAKQHYWIDTLAGIGMALACGGAVFRLLPLRACDVRESDAGSLPMASDPSRGGSDVACVHGH